MARKRITENPIVVSTGAAAAPVRRKPSTTKRTAHATAPATEADAAKIQPAVTPAEQAAVGVSAATPTYQQIAALAYSYWAGRGYTGDSQDEDWFRAERELSAK